MRLVHKPKEDAMEMTQRVKCFLYNHEDLSLEPRKPQKKSQYGGASLSRALAVG